MSALNKYGEKMATDMGQKGNKEQRDEGEKKEYENQLKDK